MNNIYLPTINAILNTLAAVFLFFGWRAIKNGKKDIHQKLMIYALISSALFLGSYVTYHALKHGVVTRYQGGGVSRGIYSFILLTHTPLAMIILPFSLIAVSHANHARFEKHKRITKWLLPVWLYVSVTGVLIYVMLYLVHLGF